MGLGLGVKF